MFVYCSLKLQICTRHDNNIKLFLILQIFQTKKGFITFSKLIINEFGCCLTRSDNVCFADNKQPPSVFTAVFCFSHAKRKLIKLKLCNN